MTSSQPQQLTASTARRLYWVLLGGFLMIAAVFAATFWLGIAPFLRNDPAAQTIIAPVLAVAALASVAMGWLWARPNLPLRPSQIPPSAYWDDPNAGARAVLLWVLWEGAATIAAVGTLLTGSVLTGGAAGLALALLLTHSPGFLEGRTS